MKTQPSKDRPGAGNVLSVAEMQALESQAISGGAVSGATLMDRAGRGVAGAIARRRGAAPPGRAVILCGPGNNGGDGYAVARLLAGAGWDVAVFALGDAGKLPPDARAAHESWRECGPVGALADAIPGLAGADLVVDALFGIGLARPLDDRIGQVLAAVPESALRVAIDVPSGWSADDARPLGPAFDADLTVTFHAWKPVHGVLANAGQAVETVDIGL